MIISTNKINFEGVKAHLTSVKYDSLYSAIDVDTTLDFLWHIQWNITFPWHISLKNLLHV